MSDAPALTLDERLAISDRKAYAEQRLFVLSPVGALPTALVLFLILTGSYTLIALLQGAPLVIKTPDGLLSLDQAARSAYILSLMLCTALFMQRYTLLRERADRPAFEAALRPGAAESEQLGDLTPRAARLWPATIVGLALGLGMSWLLYAKQGETGMLRAPLVFGWFVVVTTLLTMSFVRGVELSRGGATGMRGILNRELQIDLLRIDKLSVWGRSSARFALIWFTIGAVTCLFFTSGGLTGFTISLVALFLAIGIAFFVGTMEKVHQKIRAAKHAELERIRSQIDALRDEAVRDAPAATRLQGLLAYETRIAAAPEWPFDQTTLMRVGASALILTVPWFGQAVAAYLVEHVSRIAG